MHLKSRRLLVSCPESLLLLFLLSFSLSFSSFLWPTANAVERSASVYRDFPGHHFSGGELKKYRYQFRGAVSKLRAFTASYVSKVNSLPALKI